MDSAWEWLRCLAAARGVYELVDAEEKKRIAFDAPWSGQWRNPARHAGRLRRLELYAPDEFNLLSPRLLAVVNYWARCCWRE